MSDEKQGWFKRLKKALGRSASAISDGVSGIFSGKRKLDDDTLEELEDVLITADLGVTTSAMIIENLRASKFEKEVEAGEVRQALAEEVEKILAPVTTPLETYPSNSPHVILMVGVNGSGKTTTIGKMAKQLQNQGKKVMLAAGDTFRAAAIEQLQVWGARNKAPVIAHKVGADAAAVAFEALERGRAEGMDVVMIDTAGRLQNKQGLMDELAKIVRVIRKFDESAPHDTILVLDATTGQNAVHQVEVFREVADVSGLVMTKLDGTARGGVLVACAHKFGLPVHAIGIGEAIDDLQAFEARIFANSLVGLD